MMLIYIAIWWIIMFFQLFFHVCRNVLATFCYYDAKLCSYAFQWIPNCTHHPFKPWALTNFIFARGKSNENESVGYSYQLCQKPSNFTAFSLGLSCFMLVLSACPHTTIITLQIPSILELLSLQSNPTLSTSNVLTTTFHSISPCFKDTCLAPIIDSIKNYISPQPFSTISSTKIESITNLITIIVQLLCD